MMVRALLRIACLAGVLLALSDFVPVLAQTIDYLEYFFDEDPGLNGGIEVDFTPEDPVDETFTVDVAGLTKGTHLLNVRGR